jgi:hypothetical protein
MGKSEPEAEKPLVQEQGAKNEFRETPRKNRY